MTDPVTVASVITYLTAVTALDADATISMENIKISASSGDTILEAQDLVSLATLAVPAPPDPGP